MRRTLYRSRLVMLKSARRHPEVSRVVRKRPPASPSAPKTRLPISCHTSAGMPTLSCNRRRTFSSRCRQQRSVVACGKQVSTTFVKALSSSEPTIRSHMPDSRPLTLILSTLHRRWAKNAWYRVPTKVLQKNSLTFPWYSRQVSRNYSRYCGMTHTMEPTGISVNLPGMLWVALVL